MEREDKYIIVKWPEIQDFMEHPRYTECFSAYSLNDDDMDSYWFVPEDLYYEIRYPIQLPEGYENYDLHFTKVKRGQNLLVKVGSDFKVIKALANWNIYDSFPILLDDPVLLDGINCIILAAEKNGNL